MISFPLRLLSTIMLLSILSLGVMSNVPASGSREPLSCVMEAIGGQTEEVSVNGWVKLPNAQFNANGLEDIVRQVMEQLGADIQDYQLTVQQTNQHIEVRAEALSPAGHTLVTAQVMTVRSSGQEVSEAYLVINMEAKAEPGLSISQIQQKIRKIIKEFGPLPHITTCLIGWLDGKLMVGEKHKLLERGFTAVDATIIDTLKSEQFSSYTGFTSELADWLQVVDKKINLNIAMRYSQYDNRTYITIGSPIITREY